MNFVSADSIVEQRGQSRRCTNEPVQRMRLESTVSAAAVHAGVVAGKRSGVFPDRYSRGIGFEQDLPVLQGKDGKGEGKGKGKQWATCI